MELSFVLKGAMSSGDRMQGVMSADLQSTSSDEDGACSDMAMMGRGFLGCKAERMLIGSVSFPCSESHDMDDLREEEVWGDGKESGARHASRGAEVALLIEEPCKKSRREKRSNGDVLNALGKCGPASSDHAIHMPCFRGGVEHLHVSGLPQSVPVGVRAGWPNVVKGGRAGVAEADGDEDDDRDHGGDDDHNDDDSNGDSEDEERRWRLPPHEMVERQCVQSQAPAFSMCEGNGRTLKGRDLCRVRNAVWRCTGYVD